MAGIWIAQFKDVDNVDYLVNVDQLKYTMSVGSNTTIFFRDGGNINVKGTVDQIIDELVNVKTAK